LPTQTAPVGQDSLGLNGTNNNVNWTRPQSSTPLQGSVYSPTMPAPAGPPPGSYLGTTAGPAPATAVPNYPSIQAMPTGYGQNASSPYAQAYTAAYAGNSPGYPAATASVPSAPMPGTAAAGGYPAIGPHNNYGQPYASQQYQSNPYASVPPMTSAGPSYVPTSPTPSSPQAPRAPYVPIGPSMAQPSAYPSYNPVP
jgi:hypothetical protein